MKLSTFWNYLMISVVLFVFAACIEEQTQINDSGGAGDYKVINMTTNDTLPLKGTGVGITIEGSLEKLDCKNGDVIKFIFEPSEKYAGKYSFTFSCKMDEEEIIKKEGKGTIEHEITISGKERGLHRTILNANYSKHSEDEDIEIGSVAGCNLNVTE